MATKPKAKTKPTAPSGTALLDTLAKRRTGPPATLSARDEHGRTPLHLAAEDGDLERCKQLVAQGADPWAGEHAGEKTILERFPELAVGLSPPDSPWRVLSWTHQYGHAEFPAQDGLDEGVSRAKRWPADAKLKMAPPKLCGNLFDIHPIGEHALAISEGLAAHLRGAAGVELLPATVIDHLRKPRGTYYVLNALAIDCLDLSRCHPSYNVFDPTAVSAIAAQVIDPEKVGTAQVFRCVHDLESVIVSRALADRLAGGSAVAIRYLKR